MTNNDYRRAVIRESATLLEAIEAVNSGSLQIAMVVDDTNKLKGVLTDGDIRRALLAKHGLDAPVVSVMNTAPIVTGPHEDRQTLLDRMRSATIHQVPILKESGCLVGMVTLDELLTPPDRTNTIVLLAGGRG